jgi:50S ribosomal subunit-associated GTPase HflX
MRISNLFQNCTVYEDPGPSAKEQIQNLERENDMLRNKIEALEREMMNRSPTTKPKSKKNQIPCRDSSLGGDTASGESDVENALQKLAQIRLRDSYQSPSLTPKAATRKPKGLTTRKRDLAPEDNL